MADRQGVEIDYCPKCRGVWLDRGELDKIIERSAAVGAGAGAPSGVGPGRYDRPAPDVRPERYDSDAPHRRDQGYGYGHPHKKHRSFLGELFDFD